MATGKIKGKCPKCEKGTIDVGPFYKVNKNVNGDILQEWLNYHCNVCNYAVSVACKDKAKEG